MLYIVAIRFQLRGHGHAGIKELKTIEPGCDDEKVWSHQELVSWMRSGGQARVIDAESGAELAVAVLDGTPRYLRAFDSTRPTNVLLKLPRF